MILKELNLGKRVRCTCGSCEGTGIYKGFLEGEDLGVICSSCNGTGYYILNMKDNMQLVMDEERNIIYVVENGIVSYPVELFKELKRRDDVNYVMYGTGRNFSTSWLFKHYASEINVITYEEFLNGYLPLPMRQYTCPRQISQDYGDGSFKYECHKCHSLFSECPNYGKMDCWNAFYEDAKTIEEKQAVLRMVNKSKY